jgi:long-chain fatty acid transport protein
MSASRRRIRLVLIPIAVVAAVTAFADTGPAHTGLATDAGSATSAFYNPAGLTLLQRPELAVGVMATASDSEFTTSAANVPGDATDESSGGTVIPSVYYGRPIGGRWYWGSSISVTGGLGTSYDDDWVGRYFLQKWGLGYVGLTSSIGYKVNDRFSVGGSLIFNYAFLNQESAVLNLEPGLGDGKMEFDANDFVLGFTLAGMVHPSDRTRIGFAYHSETNPKLTDKPEFSDLGPLREQMLEDTGAFDTKMGVEATLPQSFFVGVHHRFANDVALTADVLWLDFSNIGFEQISVSDIGLETQGTEYEDILAGSVGLRFPVGPLWEVRGGVLHLTEGVKDKNRTFLLRLDDLWGIGAGFNRQFGVKQELTVNLNYYVPGDARVETDDLPLVGAISGKYDERRAMMLDVSFSHRFGPKN